MSLKPKDISNMTTKVFYWFACLIMLEIVNLKKVKFITVFGKQEYCWDFMEKKYYVNGETCLLGIQGQQEL